ncbi:hypothetical protein NP493_156g03050 [Ridgeia piscesae]|uniref:procollagen-lysine 5-dioxygenase n=1 Tax=Ridgeia piscesae TaxID=27915 RepID=A0AAD9UFU5_RIDPI|nr:hypothetical protein NP493_156g03050 [Ridgeia piscesae]
MEWKIIFVFCVVSFSYLPRTSADNERVQVLTVATEETDGFRRFMRTANKYQLNVKVLGLGEKWEGGNMAMSTGGGQKVMLLRKALEELKDEKDLVVMFVDSYDLIFTAGEKEILQAFNKFNAKVVFSAEDFCWPDRRLESQYPIVRMTEKRYLNSGGFIGLVAELYDLVTRGDVKAADDDQLFYTKLFLDEQLRAKLSVKLDTRGEIFQNLNGALEEVTLKFKGSSGYLYNSRTGTSPLVIHGNGPIKVQFNSLTNYLADQWTPTAGCQSCKEDTIDLEGIKPEDFPRVMMGIFFEEKTPFADVFFENIAQLTYPKDKIDIIIHYADEFHKRHVERFVKAHQSEYRSVVIFSPAKQLTEGTARNRALEACLKHSCLYYLAIDGAVQLENNRTLQMLIERNRSVIAPMVLRPGKLWSNFWGSIGKDGYYKRSEDYIDLVESKRKGIWNVPHITNIYMIQAFRIPSILGAYVDPEVDPDIAICARLREKDIFLYIDNQQYYGHLVNTENFDTTHLHNDLYQIFDNRYTWDKKYVHPEYKRALAADTVNPQPCPDVYWFPMVTPKFCQDYIDEMENFGKWSGGKNQDERLAGGYENVPTVDIHTNQIGWEKHWLHFLKEYIVPLNAKVFTGYYSEARAIMNFVVRYRPGEQDRLRPHHDSSTFTINIALNTHMDDYEGGGPRFLRYDCAVAGTRRGWMLMHPGRLTHFHEGMPVTKGTRYIMVSFVDP